MKLPRTPDPRWTPDPTVLTALLRHREFMVPEVGGRYLHWEELRHHPVPDGITSEAWWWGVRLARTQLARPLGLRDRQGARFAFSMTDTAQRLVHEIDRDASGNIALPEDVTNSATRDRYIVNSLIEEAFRSSQLEGASTTRRVAKEMIQTKRPPRTKSERMILNNFYAMEWVRDHHEHPLTAAAVFELHSIVTQDTLDHSDVAGRFRSSAEDIRVIDHVSGEIVHVPPVASELSARMDAMCTFANGGSRDEPFIHPVARAVLLHFWLAYDHPFVDGNGRTARALFYWSMLHQGYWLTEFISISRVINRARAQYDKAFLFSESDGNDATYFLLHQLKVMRTAIDDLHGYLKRKAQDVRDVERSLRGRGDLNHRQLAVLNDVLRHPDARITIDGHKTLSRVVYQTARTDLNRLVELGYLEEFKVGKQRYFVPHPDLARKIKPAK
ncbi:MAG: Fic family protein [Myxococcales bacterium]|nr:Fic family protein [Myxococcales bacterium]